VNEEQLSQIMLARIEERVLHLSREVSDTNALFRSIESKLDAEFVRLSRYIHIERAVIGVIGLVVSLLVAYVFTKVIGHP
jgi:hypothetical protein